LGEEKRCCRSQAVAGRKLAPHALCDSVQLVGAHQSAIARRVPYVAQCRQSHCQSAAVMYDNGVGIVEVATNEQHGGHPLGGGTTSGREEQ
jgi:hypothetical protein